MSRYRLAPTLAQEAVLRGHCAHARYVWNQARRNFFAGTHRRPSWRKAGRDEGFRVVAVKPGHIRRLSRKAGELLVPKIGWVRFRWSRPVPGDVKSYRVTMDAAGRWHVAFAITPDPVPAPGTGAVVGVDRGVAVSAGLSTGEMLTVPRLSPLRGTREQPGRNVRQKAGLNREIMRSGWGLLVRRLDEKAPGRVERIPPAFTSQRCSACGHIAAESRKSQALFACVACGFVCNADVNAARNIAAGHAVTARGGLPLGGPANREPQLLSPSV